jgi:hypothetical protein
VEAGHRGRRSEHLHHLPESSPRLIDLFRTLRVRSGHNSESSNLQMISGISAATLYQTFRHRTNAARIARRRSLSLGSSDWPSTRHDACYRSVGTIRGHPCAVEGRRCFG